MIIQPMTSEWVGKVHRLDQEVADFPWSMLMFWEEVGASSIMLMAVEEEQVLGYGVLRPLVEEWHLLTLGVSNRHRRQGIGRLLVSSLLRQASAVGGERALLEVADNNMAAQYLYLSLGFKKIGRRRGYYQSPKGCHDALVMSCPLPFSWEAPCPNPLKSP
ncbi:MAG: ribosomal protein S18-alanine N-acetyltransferase [Magnetococcales bacterium]|nr:ribosomal protein S18-alanine N-acetyltransferase [Magnetococcales bacterium]NGZ27778.1 ribosomal protein S18-alanine N-acetyltransferase [Magnetococcales bacterium]